MLYLATGACPGPLITNANPYAVALYAGWHAPPDMARHGTHPGVSLREPVHVGTSQGRVDAGPGGRRLPSQPHSLPSAARIQELFASSESCIFKTTSLILFMAKAKVNNLKIRGLAVFKLETCHCKTATQFSRGDNIESFPIRPGCRGRIWCIWQMGFSCSRSFY